MRSKLARMEPRSEACTIRISFLTRAIMKMMSSTALPKVTFINAPTVSPMRLATLSVAWLRSPANGMIAIAFIAKMMLAGMPAK
jgi:hypothetical protein